MRGTLRPETETAAEAFAIAVDVGGTFTDVVARRAGGEVQIGKGSSGHDRAFVGIREGLEVIAAEAGESVESLLAQADRFVYSTTWATNAVLERRAAKTALLVTEGFPDTLVLREGGRRDAFDATVPYPEPYVPRRLTFEIRERIDAEGEVAIALDEAQARSVLRTLRMWRVEAVAVCLLWSMANATHERTIGRLIEEELPGVPYTLSHELNPIVREYRRASATAIDASLKPLWQAHVVELERDLRAAGFAGELLAATSLGGVAHLGRLAVRPIEAAGSGRALAAVAAQHHARAEGAVADIIACDAGGTSFDVSLVRDGRIGFTREAWVGPRLAGHMTGVSSVDVRGIGAGGGSIAWIDSGGLLRVGPRSAGADPGPACYGRGGSEATVTDAAVVLGQLDPRSFLGGRMPLDEEAARRAVGALAERVGDSAEHVAHAILTMVGEAMAQAIQEIAADAGIDPSESLVVAGGGAGGLTIVAIARQLGCRTVLVPRTAGALSAYGAHVADLVAEFGVSRLAHTDAFPYHEVNGALEQLRRSVDAFARGLREKGVDDVCEQWFVEARYPFEASELEVPLSTTRFDGAADVAALVGDFDGIHDRVVAVKGPSARVECLHWKARVTGIVERAEPRGAPSPDARPQPAARSRRSVSFSAGSGRADAAVHHGADLLPGMRVAGPAVIAEPTTTIVLDPHSAATVGPSGAYLIQVD